ncbi:MAG: flavodoxin family protein [Synergistaceae bacterium]|nr:flavodoxin family protein [Synergistaceae bacterium]
MAKVLVLNGSPRRGGNTDALTAKAAEGVRSAGSQVEEIFLSALKIHPCTGCESCASIEAYCVSDDDMNGVMKKVIEADAILLASPVWWFNISTYLKAAVDRFYGALMKDAAFLKGKKLGLAFCYGGDDELTSGVKNAINSFQDIATYTEAQIVGTVQGHASEKGEILKNATLMKSAVELGKKLGE